MFKRKNMSSTIKLHNKKQNSDCQCAQRLDAQEAVIEELRTRLQEVQQNFETTKQSNDAIVEQLLQKISSLQDLSAKDSKKHNTAHGHEPTPLNGKSQIPTLVPTSAFLPENARNTLMHQLADHVDSVVGLKEAVTWKSRWLKYIWAATLLAGVIATAYFVYAVAAEYLADPTATKVKIMAKPNYAYPPIYICPPTWLDTPKALSLGLSPEALKYSLGYINKYNDKSKPDNMSSAKEEFFDFFEKNNFTSFNHYLMAISADVAVLQTSESYGFFNATSAYCSACSNETVLSKRVIDEKLCYKFQLQPETYSPAALYGQNIYMKVLDRSMGFTQGSLLWQVYINANPTLRTPSGTDISIKPFTIASIRLTQQRFVSLPSSESPCESESSVTSIESPESCIAECLRPLYFPFRNCTLFDLTVENSNDDPKKLCNIFSLSFFKMADESTISMNQVASSEEGKRCYKKCPSRCERTTYEAARQDDFDLFDLLTDIDSSVRYQKFLNMTLVGMAIKHAALTQGGIMTWTEINTISFTTLISNVGGALGLFVGGTLMTFVQLILFLVKSALERRPHPAGRQCCTTSKEEGMIYETKLTME